MYGLVSFHKPKHTAANNQEGLFQCQSPTPFRKAVTEREREGGHSDTWVAKNLRGSSQSRETDIGVAGHLSGVQTEAIPESGMAKSRRGLVVMCREPPPQGLQHSDLLCTFINAHLTYLQPSGGGR